MAASAQHRICELFILLCVTRVCSVSWWTSGLFLVGSVVLTVSSVWVDISTRFWWGAPRNGIAGSLGLFLFSLSRYCQAVLQSGLATQISTSIFFPLCFLIQIIRFPQAALNSPGLLHVVIFQIISTSVVITAVFEYQGDILENSESQSAFLGKWCLMLQDEPSLCLEWLPGSSASCDWRPSDPFFLLLTVLFGLQEYHIFPLPLVEFDL